MSTVVAFCERHNLTKMHNLLRHSSGCMQEVFAVDLLEDLMAGDADKLEELKTIKAQIHPVGKAAQHRLRMKQFLVEHAKKENETIAALHADIDSLKAQLAKKRLSLPDPVATTPRADDETQRFDDETQRLSEADSPETQPDAAAENYLRIKQARRP